MEVNMEVHMDIHTRTSSDAGMLSACQYCTRSPRRRLLLLLPLIHRLAHLLLDDHSCHRSGDGLDGGEKRPGEKEEAAFGDDQGGEGRKIEVQGLALVVGDEVEDSEAYGYEGNDGCSEVKAMDQK